MRFVEKAHAALGQVSYYDLLGVGRDATSQELRSKYYKLAARLHPDLHGDSIDDDHRRMLTAVYSRVVEAYKILTHGERREQYDQGLDDGKLRWDADAGARKKIRRAEEEVVNAGARRFFLLGRNAVLARDKASAVMNLKLALSMEPSNAVIKAELVKAEQLEDGDR